MKKAVQTANRTKKPREEESVFISDALSELQEHESSRPLHYADLALGNVKKAKTIPAQKKRH